MRYVQVNSVAYGSTGAVMRQIHQERLALGDESWMLWGRGRAARDAHEFNYGTRMGTYVDAALTRLDGKAGLHSKAVTRRLLRTLDELDPHVVHLHNLHGYHLNYEMLFAWLAARNQCTYWTLHDCWAFTGHCAYFTAVACGQWKEGCGVCQRCPQLREYPRTWCGRTCHENWQRKRAAFTQLPPQSLTLVTPSQWLAELVGQSFLAAYPVHVRHNVIDQTIFRPVASSFRHDHGLAHKRIVLGVASPWTSRKGLDDFLRLRERFDDEVAIALVGLSRSQLRALPAGILGLERTSSPEELARIYSAADVLFNPTREDNYPTVNLEAQACGTPVVTYDVGGCAETLSLERSVAVKGFDEAVDALYSILELSKIPDVCGA